MPSLDRSGQMVDLRFHLRRLLIKSGMGDVYQARDFIQNRPCTLKLVSKYLSNSLLPQQRLEHEAEVISRLSHANIVAGFEYSSDESGDLFIVMEPLVGRNLHQLLAEEDRLPLDRALRILRQLGSALQYLHSLDLVHQDIKPSSIFLHRETCERTGEVSEVVKLMSFGLVRNLASDGKEDEALPAALLTSDYAAPEIASGRVDARADQWSLAVLAHQLLTGRLPFADTAWDAGHRQVLELSTELPGAAIAALTKALSPDKEQRYPRIISLVQALDWAMAVANQRSTLEVDLSEMASQCRQEGGEPAPEVPTPVEKQGQTRQYPHLSMPALLMASAEDSGAARPPKSLTPPRRTVAARPWLWLAGYVATALTSAFAGVALYPHPPADRPLDTRLAADVELEARAEVDPSTEPAVRPPPKAVPLALTASRPQLSSVSRTREDPDAEADTVESRLSDARFEYVNGNHARAIEIAQSVKQQSPTRAWRIIGAAACNLKDRTLIREAASHLRSQPGAHHFLTYACRLSGVELTRSRR